MHPNADRPPHLRLKMYEFAGRIVGKCLYESALGGAYKQLVRARFTRSFLAQIIGLRMNYKVWNTSLSIREGSFLGSWEVMFSLFTLWCQLVCIITLTFLTKPGNLICFLALFIVWRTSQCVLLFIQLPKISKLRTKVDPINFLSFHREHELSCLFKNVLFLFPTRSTLRPMTRSSTKLKSASS